MRDAPVGRQDFIHLKLVGCDEQTHRLFGARNDGPTQEVTPSSRNKRAASPSLLDVSSVPVFAGVSPAPDSVSSVSVMTSPLRQRFRVRALNGHWHNCTGRQGRHKLFAGAAQGVPLQVLLRLEFLAHRAAIICRPFFRKILPFSRELCRLPKPFDVCESCRAAGKISGALVVIFSSRVLTSLNYRAYRSTKTNDASSKAPSPRPRVVCDAKNGVHTSHDSSHWTIAQCVGVYPKHAAAAFGSAGRGTRQPTECPATPPPVASATGGPAGRTGRLPSDATVSASTAAAIVARTRFQNSNTGGPLSTVAG